MTETKRIQYPKRLIEVDLPIKRISAHSRREKSIRHGHISTLHIWWARRPLAACRAVLCASLWPDPADPLCPEAFRKVAREQMKLWVTDNLGLLGQESYKRFVVLQKDLSKLNDNIQLRHMLLDFIADFANWDNSTVKAYLESSHTLTQSAHEALGGVSGTRPLVLDSFSGGGSIPIESLRVGADAFASDLNPVPVLLNKVILEYIPKYGQRLADEVKKWAEWIKTEAEKDLKDYYPKDPDGATPIAYLWARTVNCEGPTCGAEIPLIRSLWLAKRTEGSIAVKLIARDKHIDFEIIHNAKGTEVSEGTVKRGNAICPCCGYTTPVASVRRQLKEQNGGADSSRLFCVVILRGGKKNYRLPSLQDIRALEMIDKSFKREDILPSVPLPLMSGVFNVPIYGITRWDLLFSLRQLVSAHILSQKLSLLDSLIEDPMLRQALRVCLAISINKYLDFRTTLCGWISGGEKIGHTFGRQALGMIFDWVEGPCFGDVSGSWERTTGFVCEFIEHEAVASKTTGSSQQFPAQQLGLPDDSVDAFITDPPYYNAVPYADLSDFFQIWFNKNLNKDLPQLFSKETTDKTMELCEMAGWDSVRYSHKDSRFYEEGMTLAFEEGRRCCKPEGISVVVFAHKTTSGWESLLSALIKAGWIVTGSWPIDTEREGRLRAMGSAALASSVHLVCRPRENPDGSLRMNDIGDWRDVLAELPGRLREWMPRLHDEGVVGADAIFACLGPALEIFSKYSRVEKASGDVVTLKEYLEHVWGAVSKEALNMIFSGVHAEGLEEDARLTAMWLWTLSTADDDNSDLASKSDDSGDDEDGSFSKISINTGFMLEYDTARKIAQGLGANLDQLKNLIEVKGDKARLLPVGERAAYLFGKENTQLKAPKKEKAKQLSLFDALEEVFEESQILVGGIPPVGKTQLDKIHQSMLLFASGRSEALKRFLVDGGVGQDVKFWQLAQALSALYPPQLEEKRWVDGVLTRKKGLGF